MSTLINWAGRQAHSHLSALPFFADGYRCRLPKRKGRFSLRKAALSGLWLPFVDSFRTDLIVPSDQIQSVMKTLQQWEQEIGAARIGSNLLKGYH
jgi:hypothetical protein